jgi:hypothetical protein
MPEGVKITSETAKCWLVAQMGKEHYTRNTVEVSAWCAKCSKRTMHRVDERFNAP